MIFKKVQKNDENSIYKDILGLYKGYNFDIIYIIKIKVCVNKIIEVNNENFKY